MMSARLQEQGLWTPPIEQELRCGLKCAPCTAFSFSAKHAASSCALVQCSARWCVRNLSQLPFSSRAAAHLIHAVYSYWSFERRMKGSGLRQPLPSPHRSSSDLSLASGKQAEPKTANHQGDEERKHVEDAKRGAYKSDSLQAHRCDAASCLLAPSALESRGREQELSESMIKVSARSFLDWLLCRSLCVSVQIGPFLWGSLSVPCFCHFNLGFVFRQSSLIPFTS